MIVLYIILLVIALELMALVGCVAWRAFGEVRGNGAAEVSDEPDEAKRQAEELEKAWNDGVNSILGYDMREARKAVRRYGGDEAEN